MPKLQGQGLGRYDSAQSALAGRSRRRLNAVRRALAAGRHDKPWGGSPTDVIPFARRLWRRLPALAIAPAAEAAKKPASFKVRSLAVSDASVAPGDAVRVTGKVRNTKGRKASSARVVYSLRTSRSAKSGDRLDSEGVERTKGGKSRSFSARVDIPSSTGPGTSSSPSA